MYGIAQLKAKEIELKPLSQSDKKKSEYKILGEDGLKPLMLFCKIKLSIKGKIRLVLERLKPCKTHKKMIKLNLAIVKKQL